MTAYQTEEEQIEALKKWWQENGKAAVAGIVLGLGGVLGWQAWNQHQHTIAEQASAKYEQLGMASSQGAVDSAIKQAELLITEFGDTPYAVFAALDLARLHGEQGNSAAAKQQLQWVMDNSSEQGLQQIARLRMARLLLNEGDLGAAQKLVDAAPADSFAGEFAQLRGDIALARDDREAARKAYEQALASNVSNTDLVQMKLDDLAVAQ